MLFQRVTCDKKGTFYNSYVSGLTTFFLQHSANRGTQKNFDAFKLKLFRFAGQDNHRISDCADLTSESLRCQRNHVAPSGRSRRSSLSPYWHCRPPQPPTARAV